MKCKLCIIDSERYENDFVKEEKEYEPIIEIINKTQNLTVNGEYTKAIELLKV